jgi:hypothetical protein
LFSDGIKVLLITEADQVNVNDSFDLVSCGRISSAVLVGSDMFLFSCSRDAGILVHRENPQDELLVSN